MAISFKIRCLVVLAERPVYDGIRFDNFKYCAGGGAAQPLHVDSHMVSSSESYWRSWKQSLWRTNHWTDAPHRRSDCTLSLTWSNANASLNFKLLKKLFENITFSLPSLSVGSSFSLYTLPARSHRFVIYDSVPCFFVFTTAFGIVTSNTVAPRASHVPCFYVPPAKRDKYSRMVVESLSLALFSAGSTASDGISYTLHHLNTIFGVHRQ